MDSSSFPESTLARHPKPGAEAAGLTRLSPRSLQGRSAMLPGHPLPCSRLSRHPPPHAGILPPSSSLRARAQTRCHLQPCAMGDSAPDPVPTHGHPVSSPGLEGIGTGRWPCTPSPPQTPAEAPRKRTPEHRCLLPPSLGDLCTVAVTWRGVPLAALRRRFSCYILPTPQKQLAPGCLARRGNASAAHCFPGVSPKPLTFQQHPPQAAGEVSWGWGAPPAPSRRMDQRSVLGVAWGTNFNRLLLPYFLVLWPKGTSPHSGSASSPLTAHSPLATYSPQPRPRSLRPTRTSAGEATALRPAAPPRRREPGERHSSPVTRAQGPGASATPSQPPQRSRSPTGLKAPLPGRAGQDGQQDAAHAGSTGMGHARLPWHPAGPGPAVLQLLPRWRVHTHAPCTPAHADLGLAVTWLLQHPNPHPRPGWRGEGGQEAG